MLFVYPFFPAQIYSENIICPNNIQKLFLKDIGRIVLLNSYDVQILKYDALIADNREDIAESIFDTILTGGFLYANNELQQTSPFFGSKTLSHNYNLGLSQKTSLGSTVGIGFNTARAWSNAQTVTINPYYESSANINFEQALGKNLFGIQDRGSILITKLDVENAKYTSFERIESLVATAQKFYWDLVFATEQVNIALDFVEQAKRFFDLNKEKLKTGLSELPEVIASEANYRSREKDLILAQNNLKNAENNLRLLLNLPGDSCFSSGEELALDNGVLIADDEILEKAFLNRRDYKRILNLMKAKNINLVLANNNLWPEINLEGSFSKNGIDDSSYSSVQNITSEDHTAYSIGLAFKIPLENTKAKAQRDIAELEKTQSLLSFKALERQIVIGVLDQARDVKVYREAAASSEEVAKLQLEKLKEEEKRFNTGRSNTDTIIRYQEDLLQARLLAASAKLNYLKSLVDLDLVTGTLLNNYIEDIR
jgi:outer membrane protein TolC